MCTQCKVNEAKIYLYHSRKIAKARPQQALCPEQLAVQKQWSLAYVTYLGISFPNQHTSAFSLTTTSFPAFSIFVVIYIKQRCHPFKTPRSFRQVLYTGTNVGCTFVNLLFFSRTYGFIKGPKFIKFWILEFVLFAKFSRPHVYSLPYVDSRLQSTIRLLYFYFELLKALK